MVQIDEGCVNTVDGCAPPVLGDPDRLVSRQLFAILVTTGEPPHEAVNDRRYRLHVFDCRLRIGRAHLDRAEDRMQTAFPPQFVEVNERTARDAPGQVVRIGVPCRKGGSDALAVQRVGEQRSDAGKAGVPGFERGPVSPSWASIADCLVLSDSAASVLDEGPRQRVGTATLLADPAVALLAAWLDMECVGRQALTVAAMKVRCVGCW
jgi:hypothetical protein